jgi:exosortase A
MTVSDEKRLNWWSPISKTAVGPWSTALAWLGLCSLLLVALFYQPIVAMAETWRASASFEHGYLVPLVSAAFIWLRRHDVAAARPRPWAWGLVLVLLAALAMALGTAVSALIVQQIALIALFQSIVLTLLGPAVTRRLSFPLAYLYFAVPMGSFLVPILREMTAALTVFLLSLLDVTATQDGYFIRMPSAEYLVADACAGLRFFLVCIATGVLAAALFVKSWTGRMIYLPLVIVLPLFGNSVRTTGIILLGEYDILDPASVFAHATYGLGFTSILIALLVAVALAMARIGSAIPLAEANIGDDDGPAGSAKPLTYPLVSLCVLAIAGGAYLWGSDRGPPRTASITVEMPVAAPPWRTITAAGPVWRPQVNGALGAAMQSYDRSGSRVDLYVALFDRQREGAEVVSGAHVWAEMGPWLTVSQKETTLLLDGALHTLSVTVIESAGERRLVARIFWVDGRLTTNAVYAKVLQAKVRLIGGIEAAALIVASAPVAGSVSQSMTLANEMFHHFGPFGKHLEKIVASSIGEN